MATCKLNGFFKGVYTGNQVGCLGFVGCFNHVAGGPPGSGISAGTTVKTFVPGDPSRAVWENANAVLNQELLDVTHSFIDLPWVIEIKLTNETTFRISNRALYVEDENGIPRFYEPRVIKSFRVKTTQGEWLQPRFQIGNVKLTINNRDGFFNRFLPQGEDFTQWTGAEVLIRTGFGESLSNYHTIFKGFVASRQGITTTDTDIILKINDQFEQDEIPIPSLQFDSTNFPFVDEKAIGKSLPLIYGDWSIEVGDFGEIPATCTNALDSGAALFEWKISENALQEIGDVFLHRGSRTVDADGPIKLIDSAITKDADNGRILVPSLIPVLSENFPLLDRVQAGTGSGTDIIISDSSELDFVQKGIRVGDRVKKEGEIATFLITGVLPGQINTTGGGAFAQGQNFSVLTDSYRFLKGDKLSVFCKGKDIRVMSVNRLAEAGITDSEPLGISIGLNNSYWTVDNSTQKIFEISFSNNILTELAFSDIDPSITEITGITLQTDNTLWVFDKPLSTIYRYVLDDNELGLSLSTLDVVGLQANLVNGFGLTIDEGNILTVVDNFNGQFYKINPFSVPPQLDGQFNRSAFDINAIDITDISADVNQQQLVIVDRNTLKLYRIDRDSGLLIAGSDFDLKTNVVPNLDFPAGVSSSVDGTIFILNRTDLSIYNFNEFDDTNDNPGFIARDIIQSYAGKTPADFDLRWNEQTRDSLSNFKARAFIDKKTNIITFVNEFLQSFNTSLFLAFQKFVLFHINFDNFRSDGDVLREADIKLNTFKPIKEYNQYFNTATANYKRLPFSDSEIISDTYSSPTGIQLAGREITRELKLPFVYLRDDLDILMPLFVRLAAAEPEFPTVSVGPRFLFTQPNVFYNINFFDHVGCPTNRLSGRRFENIPAFVRDVEIDPETLEFRLKLWSLGTTAFGDFLPVGVVAGGANDPIKLTNLVTEGFVSDVGEIINSGPNTIELATKDTQDAENRSTAFTGRAWDFGFKVDIIDAQTYQVLETLEIDSVSGSVITFTTNINTTVFNSVRNSAGIITGGHLLKYSSFSNVTEQQKQKHAFFGRPEEGYPQSATDEIEEQRAGKHDFDDERIPYGLFPFAFQPN